MAFFTTAYEKFSYDGIDGTIGTIKRLHKSETEQRIGTNKFYGWFKQSFNNIDLYFVNEYITLLRPHPSRLAFIPDKVYR